MKKLPENFIENYVENLIRLHANRAKIATSQPRAIRAFDRMLSRLK